MMKRFSVAEDIYGTAVPKSATASRNVRNAASYGNLTDNGIVSGAGNTSTMDFRDGAGSGLTYIDKNGKVKRTKSFWRFSKSEEILEGMAMWKHRDLITTEQEQFVEDQVREATLKRSVGKKNKYEKAAQKTAVADFEKRSATLERSMNIPLVDTRSKYQLTKSEIDQRISKQNEMIGQKSENNTLKKQTGPPPKPERTVSDKSRPQSQQQKTPQQQQFKPVADQREEEIYGDSSTLQRRTPAAPKETNYSRDSYDPRPTSKKKEPKQQTQPQKWGGGNKRDDYFDDDMMDEFDQADMSFYDDDSMQEVTMKSIKRRDILKQYYSSGTDTERNSTSSDPYDCIVVDDHLVSAAELARKNKKNRKTVAASEEKLEFSTFKSSKSEVSRSALEQQRSGGSNTGSLLPRTKLNKSSGGHKSDSQSKYESGHESSRDTVTKKRSKPSSKTPQQKVSSEYSGWVELWGNEGGTLKK